MEEKYYLGIDLHRDSFTAYGIDVNGNEIIKGKYQNNDDSITALLSIFPNKPKVVVEATRNWMWFVQNLKRKGYRVTLAHPFRTKAIAAARIKTDSIDAKTLCHLLRSDMVPSSYIATENELEAREIVRARIQLVRDQTKTKNRIMAILGKENLNFKGSDLFGIKGKKWLREQRLTPAKEFVVTLLLERLENLKEAIVKLDKVIYEKGNNSPAVQHLMSIPGIGAVTAYTILSEIGDIKRFATADKLTAYLGLVPRIDQSGNHLRLGRITKMGNTHVRWILVQAAHRIARKEPWAKRFIYRLSKRSGKKKAIVALARKLAVIIYFVLKEQRQYYTL